ncbi:MAG TPA: PBP1A family penicillin-binding protein [Rhizomicrobium sp.]|jgi:penicillin-binding protein 1A
MAGDPLKNAFDVTGKWLHRHQRGFGLVLTIGSLVIAAPILLVLLIPTILGWFAPPLDLKQDLYSVNRPIAFTFIDAAGETVGHRGALVGERLKLEQMPDYVPAAFIAVEDRRFYSHNGIDIRGLLRATITNFRAGHVVAGGSTITQQTAKIIYTSQERTFSRKLAELADAASLEKSLSKKQILELYLNRLYLGSGAYGVDGAAHVYFGKSARNLTLPEAAMLATLTRAPSVFSPRRDLASAQTRASRVLDAMVETGAITQAQADDAKAHPAVISDPAIVDSRNFFLDTAADQAMDLASVNGQRPTSDLVVHTTLDPKLQDAARHALVRVLNTQGKKAHASQGAVVMMKPDGEVVALVGGRDYDASAFNRAIQAHRQPGSSFKPFVYLAALENGISPWDVRTDGPVDINGWSPTNYGHRQYGTITLAEALAHSVNTITAGLGQEVGISTVIEAAKRCGIESPLEQNAALALGTSDVTPIEMTTAYGAFANGGYRVYPTYVTEVDDLGGHVLYKRQTPQPQRVIASHVDKDLTAMLYGVVTSGTGRAAAIPGHEAAGKTGTTQDYRDAWFVGFTTDYVTTVWVGNDDSSPMRNVTGGTIPATIWHDVMTYAEKDLPSKPLDKSAPQPATDITSLDQTMGVDTESGGGVNLPSGVSEDQDNEQPDQNSSDDNNRDRGGFFDWLFGRDQQRRQQQQQEQQRQQQLQQERDQQENPAVPPPGAAYQRPRSYQPPSYPPPDQPPPAYNVQPRPPAVIHAPPPDQPPPADGNDDDEQGAHHPDGGGPGF